MTALTREHFDRATCVGCGAAGAHMHQVYVRGRCHPAAPVWAVYSEGQITLTCSVCDQRVTRIAVASDATGRSR